jgi:two-component system, NarL family, nitrate/nitrite response regulator NarL
MRRGRCPHVAIVTDDRVLHDAIALTLPRYGLALSERSDDPSVVLVDVAAGTRIPALRELATADPSTPLLALNVRDEDRDVLACIEAGAVGYVLQAASLDELADALHRAVRDEPLASPHVIATLMRRVAALSEDGRRGTVGSLTSRELEVVGLIEQGLSNKEIAAQLSIAVTTVKNHVHSILEKLKVHRRGEVAWVVRTAGATAPNSQPGSHAVKAEA